MKRLLLVFAMGLAAFANAQADTPGSDLIKLARSGVDGEVLQAYVETSPEPFEMSANDIITLKDLGVPAKVISAALRRGEVLDSTSAAQGITTISSDTGAPNDSTPKPLVPSNGTAAAPAAGGQNISFFYDVLAPYGNWILIDGDWCWQPNAGLVSADWAPYSSQGRWVFTDWGWCWVSDYTWGWAPFHYGRWFRDGRYGWCWWPDNEWGPAWVTWRFNDDYWGWAPLPRHIRYVRHRGFYHGQRRLSRGDDFKLTRDDFFFLPKKHLADPSPWIHIILPRLGRDLFKETKSDPAGFGDQRDHFFNRGPDAGDIAALSHKTIVPVPIVHKELKPGQPIPRGGLFSGKLEIYGPSISPDIPRRPATPVPGGSLLPDIVNKKIRDATRLTLEQQKEAGSVAEQRRNALVDSAQRATDQKKRSGLKAEAEVQDLRASQARDNMERIKQWKPAPAAPVPQLPQNQETPQLKSELIKRTQSEVREEQQKQQMQEDLIRQPAALNRAQSPASRGGAKQPDKKH
jgi:hypothetical protein